MGYHIEFNCLLVVPNEAFDLNTMKIGQTYKLEKEGERLYPLNIPFEVCDEDYNYYGKIAVRKLSLEKNKTYLEFELLKVFSEQEAAVYTSNFIKP